MDQEILPYEVEQNRKNVSNPDLKYLNNPRTLCIALKTKMYKGKYFPEKNILEYLCSSKHKNVSIVLDFIVRFNTLATEN